MSLTPRLVKRGRFAKVPGKIWLVGGYNHGKGIKRVKGPKVYPVKCTLFNWGGLKSQAMPGLYTTRVGL